MAANTGLIFGDVYNGASTVAGATIELTYLFGGTDLGRLTFGTSEDIRGNLSGSPSAQSGSDGRYALPFLWSGVDIAKVIEGTAKARIYARSPDASDGTHRYCNKWAILMLGLDVRKIISATFPDITASGPDFVSVAKDFWAAYRDMLRGKQVFPQVAPLSTEMFGLVGKRWVDFKLDS